MLADSTENLVDLVGEALVEDNVAEGQGFEPWGPFRAHTLSKRAP